MEFVGYIATVYDAFILGCACEMGLVKTVKYRPSNIEKQRIYDGKTIIFETENTGIKRWTDGKKWEGSKLKNGFFIYEEKQILNCMKINYLLNTNQLTKKVISVISPNNRTFHIVNYFHKQSTSLLITPFIYPFLNRNEIHKLALEFQYIKCYRNTSKSCRKPLKVDYPNMMNYYYEFSNNSNPSTTDEDQTSLHKHISWS